MNRSSWTLSGPEALPPGPVNGSGALRPPPGLEDMAGAADADEDSSKALFTESGPNRILWKVLEKHRTNVLSSRVVCGIIPKTCARF